MFVVGQEKKCVSVVTDTEHLKMVARVIIVKVQERLLVMCAMVMGTTTINMR